MSSAVLTPQARRCTPLDGLRPCQIRDPEWWTTGNTGNAKAIELCRTACRYATTCLTDNGYGERNRPHGVIVNAVPYDDWGRPITTCAQCGHPWHRRNDQAAATCLCPRTAADHAGTIDRMRAQRKSYAQIARATGLTASTIRNYCVDKATRERAAQRGARIHPGNHHNQIEAMRDAGVRWADIAATIGCTHNSLMSYVKRQREKGLIAA